MKKFLFLLVAFNLAWILSSNAQSNVRGRVVDAAGNGIEYVTVCVDSVFCISDIDGNFDIKLPDNATGDMKVSHISFKTKVVPRSLYQQGDVRIEMEDLAYSLGGVAVVAKKLTLEPILGKGMKLPGDATFGKEQLGDLEVGPAFTSKKDYAVANFQFKVGKCTYTRCVVRVIVYELVGSAFVPVQAKPIYFTLTPANQNTDVKVKATEKIYLKKGLTYYVGLSLVSGGNGSLHFPAHMRFSYVRNLIKNSWKKMPATLGVAIEGYRLEKK